MSNDLDAGTGGIGAPRFTGSDHVVLVFLECCYAIILTNIRLVDVKLCPRDIASNADHLR